MRNKAKAFSMVELLVTLVISIILMLIVGAISTIANSSYEKERRKAEIYNNIYYAFSLMKFNARNIKILNVYYDKDKDHPNPPDLTFQRPKPTIPVTYEAMTFKRSSDDQNFVYTDDAGEHIVIPAVTNLVFDFRCTKDVSGNWEEESCTADSKMFHITLSGEKNLNIGRPQGGGTQGSVKFNLYTDIMRRN